MEKVTVEREKKALIDEPQDERQKERLMAKGDAGAEAGEKAQDQGRGLASGIRSANGNLDKFRHLFGPQRRGR